MLSTQSHNGDLSPIPIVPSCKFTLFTILTTICVPICIHIHPVPVPMPSY